MTKLSRHWYNVLQKDGFEDIESYSEKFTLKRWANKFKYEFNLHKKPYHFYIKQDYYYYAIHFTEEYEFPTEVDKVIWHMHSDGISCRGIADALANNYRYRGFKDYKWNKDNVNAIIMKLKKPFEKYWAVQIKENFEDLLAR